MIHDLCRLVESVYPFSRACLELAVKGEYHFIGGIVSMNACECTRGALAFSRS